MCVYYHAKRNIQVFVHGDDFVAVGEPKEIQWFKKQIMGAYEIKCTIMGDDGNCVKQEKY